MPKQTTDMLCMRSEAFRDSGSIRWVLVCSPSEACRIATRQLPYCYDCRCQSAAWRSRLSLSLPRCRLDLALSQSCVSYERTLLIRRPRGQVPLSLPAHCWQVMLASICSLSCPRRGYLQALRRQSRFWCSSSWSIAHFPEPV